MMSIRMVCFIVTILCLPAKLVSLSSDVSAIDSTSAKLRRLEEGNSQPLGGDHQDTNDNEKPHLTPPPPPGGSSSKSSGGSNSGGSSRSSGGGGSSVNVGDSDSPKSAGSIAGDNVGLLAGAGIIMVGIFAVTAACERPKGKIDARVSSIEALARKASSDIESGPSYNSSGPDVYHDGTRYKIMRDRFWLKEHIDVRASCLHAFTRKVFADSQAYEQEPSDARISSLEVHARDAINSKTTYQRPNELIDARVSILETQLETSAADLNPDTFNVGLMPNVTRDESRFKIVNDTAVHPSIPDMATDTSYDPSLTGMPFFTSTSDISYDAPASSTSYEGNPYRIA